MSSTHRDTPLEHKQTHKHVEGYKPTARGHGLDKSMIPQGDHKGSGAPKFTTRVSADLAKEEVAALDDERGTN